MADLPTLEEALKLADQDSPLPSLAGPALKVLRNKIRELALQRLCAERFAREEDAKPSNDSATLTALIAELRAREAIGRAKYGTDVDRTDLTQTQWRQHLREELMDALLYSLAEERTAMRQLYNPQWSVAEIEQALRPSDFIHLPACNKPGCVHRGFLPCRSFDCPLKSSAISTECGS